MSSDGGSAFPLFGEPSRFGNWPGMTLRDFFAAKAMQALLARDIITSDVHRLSERAYIVADAMIIERNTERT